MNPAPSPAVTAAGLLRRRASLASISFPGGRRGRLLLRLEDEGEEDANEVEEEERTGYQRLVVRVGRGRDDRSDNEDDDDRVAPEAEQLPCPDEAKPGRETEHYGEFEGDANPEDDAGGKVEVLLAPD